MCTIITEKNQQNYPKQKSKHRKRRKQKDTHRLLRKSVYPVPKCICGLLYYSSSRVVERSENPGLIAPLPPIPTALPRVSNTFLQSINLSILYNFTFLYWFYCIKMQTHWKYIYNKYSITYLNPFFLWSGLSFQS